SVCSGGGGVHVHQDLVAVVGQRVDRDRTGGGQGQRFAAVQVEHAAVQPALHRVALDLSLGEGDLPVSADVVDGVVLTILGAHEGHFHQRAVGGVEREPQRLPGFPDVAGGAPPCGDRSPPR